MTNLEFIKTLDIDKFIKILGLTTGCPFGWRNNVCLEMCSCHNCWVKWLNAEYVDVPGGIV